MKKINVILIMLSLIGIVTTSCVKENTKESKNEIIAQKEVHTATGKRIKMNKVSEDPNDVYVAAYELSASVGHNSSDCSNSCTMVGGVTCHVNCQGWGSTCNSTATVSVRKATAKSTTYEAITLTDYGPTDELTYNMPARSFYIADSEFDNGYIWLNVPAQLLVRTTLSEPFTYADLSFTDQALFLNL